jgi:hypothetical protein
MNSLTTCCCLRYQQKPSGGRGRREEVEQGDAHEAAHAPGADTAAAPGLCIVQVITALESWAKPIKDAALRAIESNQATPGGSQVCICNFPGVDLG